MRVSLLGAFYSSSYALCVDPSRSVVSTQQQHTLPNALGKGPRCRIIRLSKAMMMAIDTNTSTTTTTITLTTRTPKQQRGLVVVGGCSVVVVEEQKKEEEEEEAWPSSSISPPA